ncbi:MAG: DnaJ domain-containing protein, partial [Candidatus Kerfeldbacteria bacterium]|nr:DnaJ domain-containing protein [Candidatus Kerfeldbacteria bacterium]
MDNDVKNFSPEQADGQPLLLTPPQPTLRQGIKLHFVSNSRRYRLALTGLAFVLIFSLGGWVGSYYANKNPNFTPPPSEPAMAFLLEIYDKVKENFWDKVSDEQLANLYELGAEKLTGKPLELNPKNRAGVAIMLTSLLAPLDTAQKKELAVNLGDVLLANLSPFGRSRLYTTKTSENLRNQVKNVDPTTNLYSVLGVAKDAPPAEIKKVYEEKSAELKKDSSPEAQQKLAEVIRAYDALGSAETKQTYDEQAVEPTVVGKIIQPDIFYMQIKRISPTTVDEFQKVAASVDRQPLTALVLDLRGNIGGSVDILPYFLGFFIGQNQYAYDIFHQGESKPVKTLTGWLPSLVKYKKVVVLVDGQTQSSAEVMAATLKKYNVGVLMGGTTRGWGTIENVFPFKTILDPNETY